jgi:hypothetical protein
VRDPHEAIREGENALRALIEDRLQKAFDASWLEKSGLTPERLKRLEDRKVEEQKRRPLQEAEQRPLYYADVTDLRTIIESHWGLIKPVLGDKKETEVFLDKLEDLRNPDSHQRSLWPYEVDLVYGISGHFRQALAVSRSEADELDTYYPRFERVVDSFGNVISHPETSTFFDHRVRPGTSITYQVEAWNPDIEPLSFRLDIRPSAASCIHKPLQPS